MSNLKKYEIKKIKQIGCAKREYFFKGTLEELTETFAYTLSCGAQYSHEKGNKKINQNPKGIKSLISNLNNAVNNSAANGYAGVTFTTF